MNLQEQTTNLVNSPWHLSPIRDLINHIIDNFHEKHRRQFPALIALAQKVETTHSDHEAVPKGLVNHLASMQYELTEHMMKEEEILFPMILNGMHPLGPISVMEQEHDAHCEELQKLKRIARDFKAPADACQTWQDLYSGLEELYQDLAYHIQLENHVLFAKFG